MSPSARGAIGVAGFAVALSGLVAFMGNPFSGPFGGPTQPSSGGASTSEPTFTSTQTDGGAAFVAPTGSKVCLDGATCAVHVLYDGGTVGVNGAPLEVPDGYVGISDDVVSALLSQDLSFNTLVLTKNEETADTLTLLGGRLRFVPVEVNANAWMSFSTNNGFNIGNQVNIADGAFITVDNVAPKRNTETLSLHGAHGLTLVPQAAVDACTGGREGQITTLTTDGRPYQCNGVSNQAIAFRAAWSGGLDFAVFGSNTCQTLTFTATGAVLDEPLAKGGCGSVMNGDGYLSCDVAITAADTASVRVCCGNTLGCPDLASITFSAAALR